MFEEKIHPLPSRVHENDWIACNLLKGIDRYEQYAILYPHDDVMLNRIFDVALLQEEYEICQVIKDLYKYHIMESSRLIIFSFW